MRMMTSFTTIGLQMEFPMRVMMKCMNLSQPMKNVGKVRWTVSQDFTRLYLKILFFLVRAVTRRPNFLKNLLTKEKKYCIIKLQKERVKNMKKFFRIEENYKFEWNDLRCFVTVINVMLIIIYGLSISWFGLFVAAVGVVKDLTTDRKVNGLLMHLANIVLNVYFLLMFYKII